MLLIIGSADRDRTGVLAFAELCLNHSATALEFFVLVIMKGKRVICVDS